MLIPNHPDDERLSALASRDTDATADAKLAAHVISCVRCTDFVNELGALRVALADLPDLKPPRPLQLVPPVEADHAVDRLGGWARRFFAPVLVSGAALVLVGVVGTAGPSFGGQAGMAPSTQLEEAARGDSAAASEPAASEAPAFTAASDAALAPGAYQGGETRESLRATASDQAETLGSGGGLAAAEDLGSGDAGADEEVAPSSVNSSRSPWPMVLFAGVALVVAALLMRWIFAPRTS